jgi:signal transduction histidine kinase/CheY-like chemotaxis protein
MTNDSVEKTNSGKGRHDTVLIETVQFLENISVKFFGTLDDSAVYRIILDEFAKSGEYRCCIHLLSEDKKHLKFFGSSFFCGREERGREAGSFTIDCSLSNLYRTAVQNGDGIRSTTAAITDELFPGKNSAAFSAAEMLGDDRRDAAILPFGAQGSIMGTITVTHRELPADFMVLANIFCRQVSIALELVTENVKSRAVEEALKASKAQLSNALQLARLGPWEYDVEKDLFTFNDEFYNIFRTSAEQIGGYTMSSTDYARRFLYPDDASLVGEEVGKAIGTTDPNYTRQLEHRFIYADGNIGTISVRIFVVKNAQGRTVKTYGVNQDITERRKAEEELQQYRHQLEELVTERTEELKRELIHRKQAEEELHRAQKLESLGLLAGGIAHDFNNLLCGLFGFVDLARRIAGSNKEVHECLDEAMGCYSRARDLTQQLLTFAKGGLPMKDAISLGQILKKTANLSLSGSNIQCDFEPPSDLWPIDGDEGQLSQVFSNILLNSRQAMEQGGRITIVARNAELRSGEIADLPQGEYVRTDISDQGTGIPKEALARVFDPFYTTKQTGSGLGLAISYSIIKKHDGHISIDSECGCGTVVTIHLPALRNAVPVETVEQPAQLQGTGRILFMDDEEVIRKSVAKMLENTEFEISCAKNGEEAVELYRESMLTGRPFAAVILDLTVIGGMGGEKAIRKLLELDPKVKGIVSSGYADSPVLSNPAAYGFVGDIAKPYVVDDLLRTLDAVLKKQ